jgi:hypothetical protein
MIDRKKRMERNEAVFRALNEGARSVAEELALDGVAPEPELSECVCECADADCTARILVRHEDYELARSNPARFIVAPTHVVPDIERVILELDGCVIVEKHPGEREIPIATDPRADKTAD